MAPRFALLLMANLPLAILATLLLRVVPRAMRSAPGTSAEPFWVGLAVALAPLPGSWLLRGDTSSLPARILTLVSALALGLLALRLAARGAPSGRHLAALTVGILAATAGLGAWQLAGAEIRPEDRVALPPAGAHDAPADAPDIVMISFDTMRADAPLDPRVPTPHFDALRQRATWAEYALAPVPTTVPSHLTMFTGANPFAHGVRSNYGRLPDNFRTLAGSLQDLGWRTLAMATLAAMRPDAGLDRGFEVYDNLALPRAGTKAVVDALTRVIPNGSWLGLLLPAPLDRNLVWQMMRSLMPAIATQGWVDGVDARGVALAYLQDLQQQPSPYFCFLHFSDAHTPYIPAPEVAGLLVDEATKKRLLPDGVSRTDEKLFRVISELHGGVGEAEELVEVLHRLYLEEVALEDRILGEVLASVEASGRETIVLVVGDHGEQFGEHGLLGHGNSLFEPLVRVPFLLAGPGVAAQELAPGSVRLDDLAPTLFQLLGLERLDQMEGRDLLDPASRADDPYVMNTTWELALLEDGWKLIVGFSDLGLPEMTLEPLALYDLNTDPGELANRLVDEQQRSQDMFRRLAEQAAVAEPGLRSAIGAADRLRLDALGYAESSH